MQLENNYKAKICKLDLASARLSKTGTNLYCDSKDNIQDKILLKNNFLTSNLACSFFCRHLSFLTSLADFPLPKRFKDLVTVSFGFIKSSQKRIGHLKIFQMQKLAKASLPRSAREKTVLPSTSSTSNRSAFLALTLSSSSSLSSVCLFDGCVLGNSSSSRPSYEGQFFCGPMSSNLGFIIGTTEDETADLQILKPKSENPIKTGFCSNSDTVSVHASAVDVHFDGKNIYPDVDSNDVRLKLKLFTSAAADCIATPCCVKSI
uniref:Uncharacterized protein n=1 Tax=Romanomermis culicivorax TaxID=13658 RepID=A0A915KIV5_ROMCU